MSLATKIQKKKKGKNTNSHKESATKFFLFLASRFVRKKAKRLEIRHAIEFVGVRWHSGTASIMSSWIECREMEWKNGGVRESGWVVMLELLFLDEGEEEACRGTMPPPMETVRRGARWNPVHCHVAEDHVRSHTHRALRGNNKGVKFRNERQSVGFIVRKRTGSSSGGEHTVSV